MSHRNGVAFGLTVATIVVVPGLAAALLTSMGYGTVGTVVWTIGFGGGVLFVWYRWLRPIDLTGPNGTEHVDGADSAWDDVDAPPEDER